ncbi:hypothetical protein ACWDA3_61515 [Nonomuraea rubra]
MLWRKARPDQADAVEAELVEVREQVLEARRDSDADTEQALAGAWQMRLRQLLRTDPDLAVEIQRVLDEVLTPVLEPAEQERIGSLVMKATASGHGRVYQAGRDQTIHEVVLPEAALRPVTEVAAPPQLVNLPRHTGVFVGREDELARLEAALRGGGDVVVAARVGRGGQVHAGHALRPGTGRAT